MSRRFLESKAGCGSSRLDPGSRPDDWEHPRPWFRHPWILREVVKPNPEPLKYQPPPHPRFEDAEPWHLALRHCDRCEKAALPAPAPEPAPMLPELLWELTPSIQISSIPYNHDVSLDDVYRHKMRRFAEESYLHSTKPFRPLCPPCHHVSKSKETEKAQSLNSVLSGLRDSALEPSSDRVARSPTETSLRRDLMPGPCSEESIKACCKELSESRSQGIPTYHSFEHTRICIFYSQTSYCDHHFGVSARPSISIATQASTKPYLHNPLRLEAPCVRC